MLLLLFVMALTDDKNAAPSSNFVPVLIGLVVAAIGMTYGNCGFAINPARDLSPRIFTAVAGWGTEVFTYVVFKFYIGLVIFFSIRSKQSSDQQDIGQRLQQRPFVWPSEN